MKKLSIIFGSLAGLLFAVACAVVSYRYCDLLWLGYYGHTSAPAEIAFFDAIPFAAGIAVCVVLAVVFWKKRKA